MTADSRHQTPPTRAGLDNVRGAAWQNEALCAQVGGGAWFPEGKGLSARDAKAICRRCPVRQICLDEAVARNEPFGVFGGLSQHERRPLVAAAKKGRRMSQDEFTAGEVRV